MIKMKISDKMSKMKEFFRENKINIIIILIYLVLPFIFFRDVINLSSVIFSSIDTSLTNISLREITVNLIKNFELPLWNRYIYSGYPLFASAGAGVFYPVNFILDLILPVEVSYNFSILIHYSLGGIFLYLFLNEYKLNKIASFLGGLIFMFSGVMITQRSYPQVLFSIVWFPVILLFLEKYRKTKRIEFVFISSIFYAVSFFGGSIQMFLYGSMVVLFFIIFYSFIYEGVKNYSFLLAGIVFIAGIIMAVVKIIPAYELLYSSVRNSMDYKAFTSYSFEIKYLPLLFFPYLFGSRYPISGVLPYFGPTIYRDFLIYFGILTIPFFIFGFFKKIKHKYFWIFILAFSFILVLGRYTPVYRIFYYIPLFNMFSNPVRHWFEFGLSFSILAGFGFDYFMENNKKKIKRAAVDVISFLGVVLGIFFINYFLFRNNNIRGYYIDFLGYMGLKLENVREILTNLNILNYSVYIPIILIIVTIGILAVSLFKKNKFLYIFIIFAIFLDLFLMGIYFEENTRSDYIKRNVEDYPYLYFLKEEDKHYRAADTAFGGAGLRIAGREVDNIFGYGIEALEDYSYVLGLEEDEVLDEESFSTLLRNNNIISILNTKYIILPEVNNLDNFKDNISKEFYIDKGIIFDSSMYGKGEFLGSNLVGDNIIIGDKISGLKMYKVEIDIESNKDYLITFYIKKEQILDRPVFFDFFGDDYDRKEQEFYLEPGQIEDEYIRVARAINSGSIPHGINTYFRIFTYSDGKVKIENLEIYEVDIVRYKNYEVLYSGEDIIILENKNYQQRFYFIDKVIEAKNIEEAKKILWEDNVIWDKDRFNAGDFAVVEKPKFSSRNFNVNNFNLDILEYKNNRVTLEVNLEGDGFLVFSDTYYPGWHAYIDGKRVEIYRANGMLKGIYIPYGKHIVEFKYMPSNFKILSMVSLLSFILVILGIGILGYKNNKKRAKKDI